MSQTQPELKNMVSNLFGDSSDEEDNNDEGLNDSPLKATSAPLLTNTFDEDDLFNSDDESENEEPVVRRLSKGPVVKKVSGYYETMSFTLPFLCKVSSVVCG
jgi:hypothetical protein